jgi:hypothetical protein
LLKGGTSHPGTIVHDVELLVALVVTGVKVGVAIDSLERPLGILELHLLFLVALRGNLLLAFPLTGKRAVMDNCCFYCSQNCSVSILISRCSFVLWCLELCSGHHGPPSLLPEGCHDRLSPHVPRAPPAAAASAAAVGAPVSGLMLLPSAFFFFLFLFLLLL